MMKQRDKFKAFWERNKDKYNSLSEDTARKLWTDILDYRENHKPIKGWGEK